MKRLFYLSPVLLVFVCLSGCNGDKGVQVEGRYGISGKVTYNGAPVPRGIIYFEAGLGRGRTANADIIDGEYELLPEDGHTGGKIQIQIEGFDGKGTIGPGDDGAPLWNGPFNKAVELPEENQTGYDIVVEDVEPVTGFDYDDT